MSPVPEITGEQIIGFLDNCLCHQWPSRRLENMIASYANGGPPPSDDDTAESEIVPLGFAQTRIKQEAGPKLEVIGMEPGIIDGDCITPLIPGDAERTALIQNLVPLEINAVTQAKLTPVLTSLSGRATITGIGFLYRTSPNDWCPKAGRIIYPPDTNEDILDSRFREWGVQEKISLRDIEEILKRAPNPKRMGWRREGLEQLKLWIMASIAQKYNMPATGAQPGWALEYNPEQWLGTDLGRQQYVTPVDVYWYFRKNGSVTKNDPDYGGHEEVDLYCVSRFGNDTKVCFTVENMNQRVGRMDISYDKRASEWLRKEDEEYRRKMNLSPEEARKETENERLIFFKKGMFKSVEECLIPHIEDVAIDGEQRMSDIRGAGRVMMPKLALMEGLFTSVVDGMAFGVTPNWVVDNGVPQERLDELARFKSRPGQAFPQGINLMQKQNGFQGAGQAASVLQMLDTSISADSRSGSQSMFGRGSSDFAAEAQAQQAEKQATLGRTLQAWFRTLDKVSNWIWKTLCRDFFAQKETYPCYQDARRLALRLQNYYGINPQEWDADRWKGKARRLAGNLNPQQAVPRYQMLMQTVGGIMPNTLPFFAHQILRATLGDTIAGQLTAPAPKQDKDQEAEAQSRVAISYVNMRPVPPQPMDNPVIHAKVASEAAQMRLQMGQQGGRITPGDQQGILAVLGYAESQIQRMGQTQMAEAGMKQIQEMAKVAQQIPVLNADQEPMTEKQKVDAELKARGQARLVDMDQFKKEQAQIGNMMGMAKLADARKNYEENQKTMATQRAKTQVDMAKDVAEADSQLNELPFDGLGIPA